jgi:hypothetical protein
MRISLLPILIVIASVFTVASVEGLDVNLMVCLVNLERQKRGLRPLGVDQGLNQAAQAHSVAQNALKRMMHILPGELDPFQRIRKALGGTKWEKIAENILESASNEVEAFKRWLQSPGHYRNMMGDYTHIGVGMAGDSRHNYWTQNFGNDGRNTVYPVCPGNSAAKLKAYGISVSASLSASLSGTVRAASVAPKTARPVYTPPRTVRPATKRVVPAPRRVAQRVRVVRRPVRVRRVRYVRI